MWRQNRPRLSLVLMLMTLASAALEADAKVISVTEDPDPDPRCSSTGPTCRQLYECYYLPDGDYQWCGGCQFVVRCHNSGYGYLQMTGDFNTIWDDNKKAFDKESTTCSECYFMCPPWETVPPEEGSSRCDRTGPTCVPDVNFCSSVVGAKKFQHCDYCHTYVDCTGDMNTSSISYCLGGTRFDDNAKNCFPTSYTCVECYQPCTGNETHSGTEGASPPHWETTRESQLTTATSRLLTTLMSTTTTSKPEGPPGGEGPSGGCGSGSLVVKLDAKDVKLELDLRVNPPREKTDEEK